MEVKVYVERVRVECSKEIEKEEIKLEEGETKEEVEENNSEDEEPNEEYEIEK